MVKLMSLERLGFYKDKHLRIHHFDAQDKHLRIHHLNAPLHILSSFLLFLSLGKI
jgi:hypothetical protein